jgi:hypothetical protein
LSEIVIPITIPSLIFGVLIGDRALELVGVYVNGRQLPHALVRLVDGTRFAGLPAVLAPAGAVLRVVVRASAWISAELEVLIWSDADAPALLERAGAMRLGLS